MKESRLTVTRIVNACVLLTIDGETVLTDPYFDEQWFLGLREPIGMKVSDLPKLAAILGGHGVYDHWQPQSLDAYPFKETTPVFVATRQMMAKAKRAGFKVVDVVDWNERRRISEHLTIDVAASQVVMGRKPNSYVLNAGGLRVFVGTEARDLEPLRQYRSEHGAVDVALLPIDGSSLLLRKLVMEPFDAITGARILGARVLVPFHYALKSVPLLLQTPGSVARLRALKPQGPVPEIVVLDPGERWSWSSGIRDAGNTERASCGVCR